MSEKIYFPTWRYRRGDNTGKRFETQEELDAAALAGEKWWDSPEADPESYYKVEKPEPEAKEEIAVEEAIEPKVPEVAEEPEVATPILADDSPDKSWTNNKIINYAFENYEGVVIKGNKKQLLEQIAELEEAHSE